MLRKIFKTGNSLVVSLPRDMLEPLGVKGGARVTVELDLQNHQILIRPADATPVEEVSEKFARQVSEFIDEYRPALESIARTNK